MKENEMKTLPSTDTEILAAVAAAFERYHSDCERDGHNAGHNWADYVDTALGEMDVLGDETPSGADAWEIAYLADGRKVVLADESQQGAERYAIEDRD